MNNSIIFFLGLALIAMFIVLVVCYLSSKKQKSIYKDFIQDKLFLYNELFDIVDNGIILLDEHNEIVHINSTMKSILELDTQHISKKFSMPEVVQKNGNVTLDKLLDTIKINPHKFIYSYGAIILLIRRRQKPINLYISQYYNFDVKSNRKVRFLLFKETHSNTKQDSFEYIHKLTKLPNHIKLQKDLQTTFAKLHLNDRRLAIVSMELDNFASLRAILGHKQTNNILITFANYLEHMSKEFSFSIYHTIHNSFILFMDNITNDTDIYSVINLIQDKLKTMYKMENSILHLTLSVGISLYPDNSSTSELLDNSYKALSQAKDKGHSWIVMYQHEEKSHQYDELKLYNDMHLALKKNEFEVYYQPIVDSKTKHIASAEALIRWKHPVYGIVRPDVFIPIMEKTGFIIKLGRYLVEEVLKQQKRWESFGFKQIPVSINLSLAELEKENFVQVIKAQLEIHKVSSDLIKYEITEGLAMENEDRTHKQLTELRKLGVNIMLDDFGTGYTSFSYIKKIPANTIKIDRSLVANILVSEKDQGITKSIIDLAHSIGMKVVVEGVENEYVFDMLRDIGADYIQGYYISKPVPVFEFQKFLRA